MTKLFLLFVFFVSCSHQTTQTPRYEIPIRPQLMKGIPQTEFREPSSAEEFLSNLEKNEFSERTSMRRIYFRALYDQYLRWNEYQENTEKVKSCPQYHHDKLVVDEKHRPHESLVSEITAYPAKEDLAIFPGWSLSLKAKGKRVKAYDWGQKTKVEPQLAMKKAIRSQWKNMENELKELCEEGVSENYFKVENIVTYFAHKTDFTDGIKGLKAFIMIPVFANILIQNSLIHSFSLDVTPFEEELLMRSSAWQIKSYAVELKKEQTQRFAHK